MENYGLMRALANLETKVNNLSSGNVSAGSSTTTDLTDVNNRINLLEEKLNSTATSSSVSDDILNRISNMEINILDITNRLNALESKEDLSGRVYSLEATANNIANNIGILDVNFNNIATKVNTIEDVLTNHISTTTQLASKI